MPTTKGQNTKIHRAMQKKFISEYMKDLNATQAAIRAGYSKKGARTQGSVLLARHNIQAAIAKRRDKMLKKAQVTQEMVIAEYMKLAFVDPSKMYDDKGNPLKITELPKEVAAAVTAFEVITTPAGNEIIKYKFASKDKALSDLAKHLGMFKDKEIDLSKVVEIFVDYVK